MYIIEVALNIIFIANIMVALFDFIENLKGENEARRGFRNGSPIFTRSGMYFDKDGYPHEASRPCIPKKEPVMPYLLIGVVGLVVLWKYGLAFWQLL